MSETTKQKVARLKRELAELRKEVEALRERAVAANKLGTGHSGG